jgi:hypothetical protein
MSAYASIDAAGTDHMPSRWTKRGLTPHFDAACIVHTLGGTTALLAPYAAAHMQVSGGCSPLHVLPSRQSYPPLVLLLLTLLSNPKPRGGGCVW